MMNLLHEIARCPHVQSCLQNPLVEHPCREIILSQSSSTLDEHQVPEPWSGRLEQAPILFLSSNPSIGSIEDYPRWLWSDDAIDDYFNNRFGDGYKAWIIDGTKTLQNDGTHSRSVRFWVEVRQRAIELLQRNVVPGVDYALTEIVHCKSRKEIGVTQAQRECVHSYLRRVLEIATARVIVVLGTSAKKAMQGEFNIPERVTVFGPITISGREKLITFLPHPNARLVRSFAKCLAFHEIEKLRAFLC